MREARWAEVTAIFGGTFDPPHRGHLEAIRGLLKHPGVRRVRVVPAGAPPLKTAQTEPEHRLAMARLLVDAIAEPGVSLDDREARSARTSYTADTLLELAREEKELAFVIGTDQLAALPRWHRFPALLGLCHWIVLRREPLDVEATREALATLVRSNLIRGTRDPDLFEVAVDGSGRSMKLVSTSAPPCSSTEIRRELALRGVAPAGMLLPAVEHYLKEKRLYGTHIAN